MTIKTLVKHFNFRREAKELGLPLWESPSFLFAVMGVLTIVVMIATYYSARIYEDPAIIVGAVSIVTVFILTISTIIIRSVERVVEASRMKSEFISIASHELKTPLSAIKWALDLLIVHKKEQLNIEQLEYLIAIKDNNERLIKLTSSLLDVSRIESGTLTLYPSKCAIVPVIEETVNNFKVIAQASNISIEFIPPIDQIPILFIDSEKLKVIVGNILNNAIKYIRGNGCVKVTIEQKRKVIMVKITDTGVGIPRHDQPFIFSKFYRSNNKLLYQTSGAGLGLFIAKAFIEASGGKIGFESEEKKGSTFWFTLPIK